MRSHSLGSPAGPGQCVRTYPGLPACFYSSACWTTTLEAALSTIEAGYFGATLIAALSLGLLTTLPESPMFMLLFEDYFGKDQVLAALK